MAEKLDGARRKCVAGLSGNAWRSLAGMTGRKYGQLDCNLRPNEQL